MDFSELTQVKTTVVKARRNPVTVVVMFCLPDDVRDRIPMTERCKIEGEVGMTFYFEPQLGDCLAWKGFLWEVTGRLLTPNEYKAKGARVLPVIATKYLGNCP